MLWLEKLGHCGLVVLKAHLTVGPTLLFPLC